MNSHHKKNYLISDPVAPPYHTLTIIVISYSCLIQKIIISKFNLIKNNNHSSRFTINTAPFSHISYITRKYNLQYIKNREKGKKKRNTTFLKTFLVF